MMAACPEAACHEDTPEIADQIPITPMKRRNSAVRRSAVGTADVESAVNGTRAKGSDAWPLTDAPSAVPIMFDSHATSLLASHLPNPTRASPAPNMPRPLPKASSQSPPCVLIILT